MSCQLLGARQRFDLFHGELQPLIAVIDVVEILDLASHVGQAVK